MEWCYHGREITPGLGDLPADTGINVAEDPLGKKNKKMDAQWISVYKISIDRTGICFSLN